MMTPGQSSCFGFYKHIDELFLRQTLLNLEYIPTNLTKIQKMPTPPSLSLIMHIGTRCNEWGFCEKPSVALKHPDYLDAQSEWEQMSQDLRSRMLLAESEELPDMISQYPNLPPWTNWMDLASDQHYIFQIFCDVQDGFDEWANQNNKIKLEKTESCYDKSAIFRAYGGGIRMMTSYQSRYRNFGNTRGIISVLQMIQKYHTDQEFEESDHIVWNGSALLQYIDPEKMEMFKYEL